jgi:hypothetical protein
VYDNGHVVVFLVKRLLLLLLLLLTWDTNQRCSLQMTGMGRVTFHRRGRMHDGRWQIDGRRMPIFIHSTTTTTTSATAGPVVSSAVFRLADRSRHRQEWSSRPIAWVVDGQLGVMMLMMM